MVTVWSRCYLSGAVDTGLVGAAHLQDDHIDPVANGGLTTYTNSQPLCPHDHRIKTELDRKAGLLRRGNKPRRPDPQRAGPNRDQARPRLL